MTKAFENYRTHFLKLFCLVGSLQHHAKQNRQMAQWTEIKDGHLRAESSIILSVSTVIVANWTSLFNSNAAQETIFWADGNRSGSAEVSSANPYQVRNWHKEGNS